MTRKHGRIRGGAWPATRYTTPNALSAIPARYSPTGKPVPINWAAGRRP